ncbi:MAG: hypothetical protein HY430_03600 [Candidatus Levybacteria bacterium]|nr:hypothetical protein [Candidatus Levybacteria bacterium]
MSIEYAEYKPGEDKPVYSGSVEPGQHRRILTFNRRRHELTGEGFLIECFPDDSGGKVTHQVVASETMKLLGDPNPHGLPGSTEEIVLGQGQPDATERTVELHGKNIVFRHVPNGTPTEVPSNITY